MTLRNEDPAAGVMGRARRIAVALWCALLVGCGGGGTGGADEGPLPGADYFPLADGDRWLYTNEDGSTQRSYVAGRQNVGGLMATVVRDVDASGEQDTFYVKTPTGVSTVPSPADSALVQAMGPLQALRLPLRNGDHWVSADKSLPAFEDLDGDGRADDVTLHVESRVLGFETVTTPAGDLPNSARVRTEMRFLFTGSASGTTVRVTATMDTWYAPGIGPVRTHTTVQDPTGTVGGGNVARGWRVGSQRSESTAPVITQRTPAAESVAYGSTFMLTIGFDEAMDTTVPAASVWTITGPDGQLVQGLARWLEDGRSLSFSRELALPSGRYTARVSTGATDWLGNAPAADIVWTFDVDASGPAATPVSPLAGAVEVPLDSSIIFTLDEDPDPSTVTSYTVVLTEFGRSEWVAASVSLDGRTVTLRPAAPLRLGARYQVAVNGIKDRHGNLNAAQSWQFTADPGRFAAAQQLVEVPNVTAAATGDIDGDGRADVLMATGFNWGAPDEFSLFVRRSLGQGRFAPAERYAGVAAYGSEIGSLVVADLGGGRGPAVVAGASGWRIQIFRPQADGTLASSQVIDTPASAVVRVADMNGDGLPDLVGRPFTGEEVQVWLQGADGHFGAALHVPLMVSSFGDMAVGDIDGDGRADIAATSGQVDRPVGLVLPNADGSYKAASYPMLANTDVGGLVIGDIDGAGRAELVAACRYSTSIAVLRLAADGSWTTPVVVPTAIGADRVRLADVDGDGRLDVVSWVYGGWPIQLNRQRSDGRLGAAETWPVADYGTSTADLVAAGDLDGDGRLDLVHGSAWLRQREVPYAEPVAAPAAASRHAAALRWRAPGRTRLSLGGPR